MKGGPAHPEPSPLAASLGLRPGEAIPVNARLSMLLDAGRWVYFLNTDPIDSCGVDDRPGRARCLGRFALLGLATHAELARAHGISARTVARARRQMEARGEQDFDKPRKRRRLHGIEDAELLRRAGEKLAQGASLRGTARELGLCYSTLRAYLRKGLLAGVAGQQGAAAGPAAEGAPAGSEPAEAEVREPPDKERRNQRDAQAPQGRATCDTAGRTLTSLGPLQEREPRFAAASAVSGGGVLTAVPALVQAGLLRHEGLLRLPKGFYGVRSILLLLAFLLLARVRNPERLRYEQPGEWGALLGLDRCPCDRTLRRRTRQLVADTAALEAWRGALARDWAGADPEAVATLFVDGHVQVYSGQGRLPKHFVPRQKLCLPAAASYWVGALGGAPLLCVHKQVDPALVAELRDGLLPQLEELGLLPAAQEPSRPRLTLVFDREGWSPALFAQLAERGIAVITWRKGPQAERWPDSEFVPARLAVHAPGGEQALEGRIAERKAALGNACAAREIRFWIDRRLRRPGKSGQPRKPLELAGQPAAGERQPAILTTHPTLPAERVAGLLRSRWTQENFFKYMRAEFGLDTLAEHALVGVDADERVVNPLWRWLERALRRLRGKAGHLHRKLAAERGARSQKALQLQAETAAIERRITGLELAKSDVQEHVRAGDLSPEERLQALPAPLRNLLDTLRMIAYRAETAMAGAVAPELSRPETVRPLLKALFRSDATLLPDSAAGTLTVRLLHQASRGQDAALAALLKELNETATLFPGTDLRLVYEILPDNPLTFYVAPTHPEPASPPTIMPT